MARGARNRDQPASRRIVIVGAGHIGSALAAALAGRHDVFVVDHDPVAAEALNTLDVQSFVGSATSPDDLRLAHVEKADVFISCTDLDEVNIVACSLASRLGKPETVCFVSTDDFLKASGGGASLNEHFGIGQVVWPEAQLASAIERIIAVPGAVDAESFADGRIKLVEYRIPDESSLASAAIQDLHLPRGALIVAAKHRGTFMIPHGPTRLERGDKVIVMGTPGPMQEIQRLIVGKRRKRKRSTVTIIGGGDVGFRLAQRLDGQSDVDVRLIERDAARGEFIASELQHSLVLNGDGTDLELLESEQIGASDVLVSVIDNDEKNLLASLLGRQLGVGKVITRVSKAANLRLFDLVGIDVALSARSEAVAAVVHHIEGGTSSLLAVLEEGEARVLEIEAPPNHIPKKLRELVAPPNCIVGGIVRGDKAFVPRGDDLILPRDRLIVFTASESADRVRDYFQTPNP